MLHLRLALVGALLLATTPAAAVTIDWVTIGDPGNAADTTGYGAVATNYQISETEITNGQYAEFLNAVAQSDPHGLYNPNMNSSSHGGITQLGSSGSFAYSTKVALHDSPVNFVSFWDALRFSNWLHNGQTTNAASTESGSYTLTPTGIANNTVTRNTGASIVLTSEDEWYKAAYYASSGSWFDYPVGSDTQTLCTALTGAPNSGNCANAVGTVSDVGAYVLSSSAQGTFDQAGNVTEWTEAIISGSTRNIRGGDWFSNPANQAASFRTSSSPTVETSTVGFRVALVPEPGTGLLVAAGLVGIALRRRSS